MSPTLAFIIVFSLFFILLALRMPIAFVLIGCGIFGYILIGGIGAGVMLLPKVLCTQISNVPLMVISMFVLCGSFVSAAGVTQIAFDMAYRWIGKLPGGLAAATVGGCALFAATSGSSVATTIALGKICVPQMRRHGYSDVLAAGTAASGGLLGIMIPPSIPFVIYGVATETSVGQLLIAGIFPGIFTALIFIMGIVFYAKLRPASAPRGESFPWKERFIYLGKSWGILLLFLIIIGGIYLGVFSPTEAGAAGAFVAFLLILQSSWKGNFFKKIKSGFTDAVPAFVSVFLILVGGLIFSSFITWTGMTSVIAKGIVDLGLGKYPTLILILLFYIPLGMFLDPVSMVLITLPFFFPVVKALGFHPVWFGVIIVKMIEVANLTPPFGMNVFACKSIAPDIPLEQIFKGSFFFLFMEYFVILPILVIFPEISLFLPSKMF